MKEYVIEVMNIFTLNTSLHSLMLLARGKREKVPWYWQQAQRNNNQLYNAVILSKHIQETV